MSRIVMAGQGGWTQASFVELPQSLPQPARPGSAVGRDPAASGYEAIRAAEREAEAILLTAREVAQQIEREAYQEGYAKGHAEALDEMYRRLEPLEELLRETCGQVASSRHLVIAHAEGALIDLALAVAERVLRSELSIRREALAPIVRAALEAAGSRRIMALRVNPGDYELLAECRGELFGSLESVRLISDAAISSGGCLVEVETGLVDARLESQIQEVARLLGRDRIS